MSWYSKLRSVASSFLSRGPLGEILRRALGLSSNAVSDGPRTWKEVSLSVSASPPGISQIAFFTALFSLLGKMAKADGSVSSAELFTIERFIDGELELNTHQKLLAVKIFRTARHSERSFDQFAEQYLALFRGNKAMLENMLDLLLALAHADGMFSADEERLVFSCARSFGLSAKDYKRLRSRHVLKAGAFRSAKGRESRTGSGRINGTVLGKRKINGELHVESERITLEQSYKVLGCSSAESDDEIRNTYRRLLKRYHPDKLATRGLPAEFQKFTTKRFRQIQKAYDAVKEARGI